MIYQRPGRIETLMAVARLMGQRGTCSRLQVGALVHRDGRILVTGYNGAPSKIPHCRHGVCICKTSLRGRNGVIIDSSHTNACIQEDLNACRAQHAERNCIDWAAREGIRLHGAEMITTDSPCLQCAGSILNSGITQVVFFREYRLSDGVDLLRAGDVSCVHFEDVQ